MCEHRVQISCLINSELVQLLPFEVPEHTQSIQLGPAIVLQGIHDPALVGQT